jgi:hypothetical protein
VSDVSLSTLVLRLIDQLISFYCILAPPTLENLQTLPPVSSLDNISVTDSFDEFEQFPPPPEDFYQYDEDALLPPRRVGNYVNEM